VKRSVLRAVTVATIVAVGAVACAQSAARTDPQTMADETTRGVYDADYDRTTKDMDAALKLQVTRGTIGQLSDRMHALGALQNFKLTSSDPDKGRYDYEATFDRGAMLVQIRLDPNGKIGAYRVSPVIAGAH
jgi:hypothetical protein